MREEPLHELLRRLPDFADVAKEQEAMAFAEAYPDPHRALEFLVHWPDLKRAARLVEDRQDALDGDRYWNLAPAAEVLEAKAPLAPTLLFRKMIEFTLDQDRSTLRPRRPAPAQLQLARPADRQLERARFPRGLCGGAAAARPQDRLLEPSRRGDPPQLSQSRGPTGSTTEASLRMSHDERERERILETAFLSGQVLPDQCRRFCAAARCGW